MGEEALRDWLTRLRAGCDMVVETIPWRDCRQWRLEDGRIVHETGGFFSIGGLVLCRDGERVPGFDQPIILQPEIGLQGVLIRARSDGSEILIQGKPEPGNVHTVQAAPTVQATQSNYLRLHRGKATHALGHFLATDEAAVVSDSLQSEQGTRFLGKYNRNMVVELRPSDTVEASDGFAWFPIVSLLDLLLDDFQINTDLRSVMATTEWQRLSHPNPPFARWRQDDGLGRALLDSYERADGRSGHATREILARLARLRESAVFDAHVVDLVALENWTLDTYGLRSSQSDAFRFEYFAIQTSHREVSKWNQPLISADGEDEVILLCQRREGILYFLFRARAEIGFRERFQYGPTLQHVGFAPAIVAGLEPQEEDLQARAARAPVLLANRQSDEGSRFYRCVARYSIRQLADDEEIEDADNLTFMTLGQIQTLIKHQGIFSNEARSLISMLLSYV